jgi:hypothetical protein
MGLQIIACITKHVSGFHGLFKTGLIYKLFGQVNMSRLKSTIFAPKYQNDQILSKNTIHWFILFQQFQ